MAVVVEELIELLGEGLLEDTVIDTVIEGTEETVIDTVIEGTEETVIDTVIEGTEDTVIEGTEDTVIEGATEEVASLGARIGAVLGAQIQTTLTKVLGLLKTLGKETLKLVMLQMVLDDLPEKYKKKLAAMIQKLADAAKKLLKTSDKYVELSGGSEEGKKLAKETQGIVDNLHEHVRKLTKDSPPRKVKQLSKEELESMMEAARKQEESNEQDLQEVTTMLEKLNGMLDKHQHA